MLDMYDIKARIFPGLLMILPIAGLGHAFFPGFQSLSGVSGTLLATMGGPFLLKNLIRDAGNAIQESIYWKTGGKPSTRFLRHRDNTLDAQTKARYHLTLALVIPGLRLPTPTEENRDPVAADQAYESACNWLRANTRDKKKFPLIGQENANYGFRRNLFGIRAFGIAVAAASVMAGVAATWLTLHIDPFRERFPYCLLATAFCCGMLLLWWKCFTRAWVASSARAYAIALLGACELFAQDAHNQALQLPSSPPRSPANIS